MSDAHKSTRNRENYLRRREELKAKARDRYHAQKHLNDSSLSNSSQSSRTEPRLEVTPDLNLIVMPSHLSQHNETKTGAFREIKGDDRIEAEPAQRPKTSNNKIERFMRILLIISLLSIEMIMLKRYFETFDDFGQFSLPVAMATTLSVQSLLFFRLKNSDLIRKLLYMAFYCLLISTQGFQIYQKARNESILSEKSLLQVDSTFQKEQLQRTEANLEWAKKTRSWENVRDFGNDRRRLIEEMSKQQPAHTQLGSSDRQMIGVSAFLSIALRALFFLVCSLHIMKLKEDLSS